MIDYAIRDGFWVHYGRWMHLDDHPYCNYVQKIALHVCTTLFESELHLLTLSALLCGYLSVLEEGKNAYISFYKWLHVINGSWCVFFVHILFGINN